MMDGLSLEQSKDDKELYNMTLKEIIEYVIDKYNYYSKDDYFELLIKLYDFNHIINYDGYMTQKQYTYYVMNVAKDYIETFKVSITDLIDGSDTAYELEEYVRLNN